MESSKIYRYEIVRLNSLITNHDSIFQKIRTKHNMSTTRAISRARPMSQRQLLTSSNARHFTKQSPRLEQVHAPEALQSTLASPSVAAEAPLARHAESRGFLVPSIWIGSAFATGCALHLFAPSSTSTTGHAMKEKLFNGRKSHDRKRGYLGADETEAERAVEAGLIKQAAMEKRKALRNAMVQV